MGLHVCVNIIIVLTAGFYNIYGSGEALPIPSYHNFRQVGYSVVDRILYGLMALPMRSAKRVFFHMTLESCSGSFHSTPLGLWFSLEQLSGQH
jgi:hypothetical protein